MTQITKSVFDEIIASVGQPTCEQREIDLPKDMLVRKASSMAKRGYRFSEGSLEALRLYMSGYGLFVYGGVGTGKTMFFRLLRNYEGKGINIFSMHKILGRSEVEIRELMDSMSKDEVLLDDIGAEPTFNNFGVKFDILAYMVERRLESRMRTHFTTNLTKTEIIDRYGDRLIDRITEMCRSVEFGGKSQRSPKVNREVVAAMDRYTLSHPNSEVA